MYNWEKGEKMGKKEKGLVSGPWGFSAEPSQNHSIGWRCAMSALDNSEMVYATPSFYRLGDWGLECLADCYPFLPGNSAHTGLGLKKVEHFLSYGSLESGQWGRGLPFAIQRIGAPAHHSNPLGILKGWGEIGIPRWVGVSIITIIREVGGFKQANYAGYVSASTNLFLYLASSPRGPKDRETEVLTSASQGSLRMETM